MAGGGVGEAMLIGAMTGAGTSAVTGGDPLKGALLGAAGGGLGAGVAGATTGAASGTAAGTTTGTAAGTATGTAAGTTAGTAGASGLQFATPAEFAAMQGNIPMDPFFAGDPGVATQTLGSSGLQPLAQTPSTIMDPALSGTSGVPVATSATFQPGTVASGTPATNPMFPRISKLYANNPTLFPAAAGAATSAMFSDIGKEEDEDDKYRGALSDFSYSRSGYTPYRAASGGLMDSAVAKRMMKGGHLGSYSDGGRLLKGPGDGMSDNIPAKIGSKQPARLADGEFVVPADVVSGIGNGSTDAGARRLYDMMDKVRKARTGSKKQGKEIDSRKYMPA